MSDLQLHYNSVGRFLLHLKFNSKFYNSFEFLKLKELTVSFFLKHIEDLDNICIANYFFFLKYFFGRIGFFLNYSYVFSLNIGYHSFMVQTQFYNKEIYYPLYFLINDICGRIGVSNYSKDVIENQVSVVIKDMNYFTEKKNTLGFFSLLHYVNFNIKCKGAFWMLCKNLLYIYKI